MSFYISSFTNAYFKYLHVKKNLIKYLQKKALFMQHIRVPSENIGMDEYGIEKVSYRVDKLELDEPPDG